MVVPSDPACERFQSKTSSNQFPVIRNSISFDEYAGRHGEYDEISLSQTMHSFVSYANLRTVGDPEIKPRNANHEHRYCVNSLTILRVMVVNFDRSIGSDEFAFE